MYGLQRVSSRGTFVSMGMWSRSLSSKTLQFAINLIKILISIYILQDCHYISLKSIQSNHQRYEQRANKCNICASGIAIAKSREYETAEQISELVKINAALLKNNENLMKTNESLLKNNQNLLLRVNNISAKLDEITKKMKSNNSK